MANKAPATTSNSTDSPTLQAAPTPVWPVGELRLHERQHLVPPIGKKAFEALVDDIRARGLQSPLAVTAEGVVLDGRARLAAAGLLCLQQVPVQLLQPADEQEYMLSAALLRRHLSASQQAAVAIELAEYRVAREEAERRRLANLSGSDGAEVATLPPRGERTRELAARLAGVSPRTVQDVITVRSADPDLYEAIKEGRIAASRAFSQIKRALRDAQLAPAGPLPDGSFELIYADPPWAMGNPDSPHAPEQHYPTMRLAEIKALPVPAADNAVLFLWAVSSLLPEALEVIHAWGFEYKSNFVWVKPSIGPGVWARNRHELLLIGRRGNWPPPETHERVDSVIEANRGRHSQKPASVFTLLEQMYPHASKLELFARGKPRPGWIAWGNEANP